MTNFLPPFEKFGSLDPAILTSQVVASASTIFETLQLLSCVSKQGEEHHHCLQRKRRGWDHRLAMSGKLFTRKLDAKRLFVKAMDGSKTVNNYLRTKHSIV